MTPKALKVHLKHIKALKINPLMHPIPPKWNEKIALHDFSTGVIVGCEQLSMSLPGV
jgi:hypothetical protein